MTARKPNAEPAGTADHTEAVVACRAYLQAMAEGDTEVLDALLDAEFTLTHMTGYVQPRTEWLSQLRAGQSVTTASRRRISMCPPATPARCSWSAAR
ncbi:nuclear transport factor 2 family protein [Streptomyces sp. NPDC054783]